ncbi:hypothetical protein F4803DRAFT_570493 [Xylaria telfairii]|nr:hypothetical protein F4803DRAFT_570493 [Xylaria telfairii]
MMIRAIFPLLVLLHLTACEKASITQAPVFASQRPCAQDCFAYPLYEGPDRLAEAIGCDYRVPQNECVCRPDLQADADAFLLSCVNRGCSQNALDTNSATSIYDEYCTSAGYLRSTPATVTSGTDESPSTVTVTVTATGGVDTCAFKTDTSTTLSTLPTSSSSTLQSQQTLHTSQTSSSKPSNPEEDPSSPTNPGETPAPTNSGSGSGNSGGSGNSLGTGEIIGIVVGIAGFVATAIGTWFTYKSIMNKKSSRYPPHIEMR